MPQFERRRVQGGAQSSGFPVAPPKQVGFEDVIASDIGRAAGRLTREAFDPDFKASRQATRALIRSRGADAALNEDTLAARQELGDMLRPPNQTAQQVGEFIADGNSPQALPTEVVDEIVADPNSMAYLFSLSSRAGNNAEQTAQIAMMLAKTSDQRMRILQMMRDVGLDTPIDEADRGALLDRRRGEQVEDRDAELAGAENVANINAASAAEVARIGNQAPIVAGADDTVINPAAEGDDNIIGRGVDALLKSQIDSGETDPNSAAVQRRLPTAADTATPEPDPLNPEDRNAVDQEIDVQLGVAFDNDGNPLEDSPSIEPSLRSRIKVRAEELFDPAKRNLSASVKQAIDELAEYVDGTDAGFANFDKPNEWRAREQQTNPVNEPGTTSEQPEPGSIGAAVNSMLLEEATGESVAAPQAKPNARHIDALRQNRNVPGVVEEFNRKFGPGAAEAILSAV